ncbi:MAG: hypothetical protein R2737_10780 [Candidatus Nanopelagicales bacterium]
MPTSAPPPAGPGGAPPAGGTPRWAWAAAAVLAIAAIGALAFWFGTRSGGDQPTASTSSPVPASSAATQSPQSTPPPTPTETTPSPEPTTESPTPTTPAGPEQWIGLEYRGDQQPAPGVVEVGGALLETGNHAATLMETPDGYQFWLARLTGYDGDIPNWRVTDAVTMTGDPFSDNVVLGSTLCEVDGVPQTGVVAVFVAEDAPKLTQMIDGYGVDLDSESFYPLEATVSCENEGYGV